MIIPDSIQEDFRSEISNLRSTALAAKAQKAEGVATDFTDGTDKEGGFIKFASALF